MITWRGPVSLRSRTKRESLIPLRARSEGDMGVGGANLFTRHAKVGIFHSYRKLLH